MDKFDRQIITLLRQDARTSVSQIAREVNLSRSAVGERIRQLEQSGVIRGYHAQVADPAGSGVKAFLELFYKDGRCQDYVERMRAHTAGLSDIARAAGWTHLQHHTDQPPQSALLALFTALTQRVGP